MAVGPAVWVLVGVTVRVALAVMGCTTGLAGWVLAVAPATRLAAVLRVGAGESVSGVGLAKVNNAS